jgi:hypothetical protein
MARKQRCKNSELEGQIKAECATIDDILAKLPGESVIERQSLEARKRSIIRGDKLP